MVISKIFLFDCNWIIIERWRGTNIIRGYHTDTLSLNLQKRSLIILVHSALHSINTVSMGTIKLPVLVPDNQGDIYQAQGDSSVDCAVEL